MPKMSGSILTPSLRSVMSICSGFVMKFVGLKYPAGSTRYLRQHGLRRVQIKQSKDGSSRR